MAETTTNITARVRRPWLVLLWRWLPASWWYGPDLQVRPHWWARAVVAAQLRLVGAEWQIEGGDWRPLL